MNNRTPVRKRRLGPPRRGVVCELLSIRRSQFSFLKIESAHVGQRGISQTCPDREAIPLCIMHHTEGPHSHHRLGKGFWAYWKLDRFGLIERFNAQYEVETGLPRKPIRDEIGQQEKKEIA